MRISCGVAALALGLVGCDGSGGSTESASRGACDTSASNGSCVEYLHPDDYTRGYCGGGMGGTWIDACPTANRVASCRFPSSIQYWYSNYGQPLADVEYQCSLYGSGWTTY